MAVQLANNVISRLLPNLELHPDSVQIAILLLRSYTYMYYIAIGQQVSSFDSKPDKNVVYYSYNLGVFHMLTSHVPAYEHVFIIARAPCFPIEALVLNSYQLLYPVAMLLLCLI